MSDWRSIELTASWILLEYVPDLSTHSNGNSYWYINNQFKQKSGLSWGASFLENCGKIADFRSFYGRSFKIDRSVGRQKSTATDRLRPTAKTTKNFSGSGESNFFILSLCVGTTQCTQCNLNVLISRNFCGISSQFHEN